MDKRSHGMKYIENEYIKCGVQDRYSMIESVSEKLPETDTDFTVNNSDYKKMVQEQTKVSNDFVSLKEKNNESEEVDASI